MADDAALREAGKQAKGENAGEKVKTVAEILKDAYENKLIGKEEYDSAVYKLLKREVTGDHDSTSVTEFTIFKNDGRIEMVLKKGEVDIPTNSNIEVKKGDGCISIRSASEPVDEAKVAEIRSDISALSKSLNTGPSEKKDVFDSSELENIEKEFRYMGGPQDDTGIRNETSTLKEDLELIDLRKEFQDKEDEAAEEPEVKEEEEPGLLDGILDRVLKLTGRFSAEGKETKLRRMSLENLGKIKEIKDERRALIGVAYVLKQFLEIRFDIKREVTYHELVDELKPRDIDRELKEQLMDFFRRMPVMMYARVPLNESLPKAYNIAEKTINTLSANIE